MTFGSRNTKLKHLETKVNSNFQRSKPKLEANKTTTQQTSSHNELKETQLKKTILYIIYIYINTGADTNQSMTTETNKQTKVTKETKQHRQP